MDHLRERLDALEQQVHSLTQRTQMTTRRLRWWRGLAGGLLVVAVLTWGLPVVTADDTKKGLEQRVAALEKLLKHFSRKGNEITIKGANLHIVNGLGRTDCGSEEELIPNCPNGLGNLIVGYNAPRGGDENIRTGSHNVVVGPRHWFSRFGGLVIGHFNTASGSASAVSGGVQNTASGFWTTVSGGQFNEASGEFAAASGGRNRTAEGEFDWVAGSLLEDD